jgi:hypothetical protein
MTKRRGNPPGVGNPHFGKSIKNPGKPDAERLGKVLSVKVREDLWRKYKDLEPEQRELLIQRFRQMIEEL